MCWCMLALNIAAIYFLWFWQYTSMYAVSNYMLGSLKYRFQMRGLGSVFALLQYLHWLSNGIIRKILLFGKLRCVCHVAWKKGLEKYMQNFSQNTLQGVAILGDVSNGF